MLCWSRRSDVFFFFFQAEDGIRDLTVTGVQTCALPICNGGSGARGIRGAVAAEEPKKNAAATGGATTGVDILDKPNPAYSTEGRILRIEGDVVLEVVFLASSQVQVIREIGRASCRERV